MKWHRDNITLFFDYDGTIHGKSGHICPGFPAGPKTSDPAGSRPLTLLIPIRRSAAGLARSTKEMWDSFLPDLPDEYKKQAGNLIGDEMLRLTRQGGAVLYPGRAGCTVRPEKFRLPSGIFKQLQAQLYGSSPRSISSGPVF